MRLWWRLRRRPTPEPLALGRAVEFVDAGPAGRSARYVPTEFVWDNGSSRIVFQDEKSYLEQRRLR